MGTRPMYNPWTYLIKRPIGAWFTRRRLTVMSFLLLCAYFVSGITLVKPDEIGVHLRFGKIINAHLDPGLHFVLPWPVDKVLRVRANRVFRAEVGFRTDPAVIRTTSALLWETRHYNVPGYEKHYEESVGLSGDEYILDFSIVVHYRPRDAVVHLLRVNQIHEVIRGLAESCLRQVLASSNWAVLMTEGRSRVLGQIRDLLSQEVDRLELGVKVLAVHCHDLHPPLITLAKFRDVFSAREDRVKFVSEAQAIQNAAVPRARSDGKMSIADAESFHIEKKLHAEGEADRFLLTAKAYEESPELTGLRLFLETIEQSLAKGEIYIANPRANMADYRVWLFTPSASSAADASGL